MARRSEPVQRGLLFDGAAEYARTEPWQEHWRSMPEFDQKDLAPVVSNQYEFEDGRLYVHFESREDKATFDRRLVEALRPHPGRRPEDLGRGWFSTIVEQDLSRGLAGADRKRTQSVWWPEAEIGRFAGKAYVGAPPRLPRFPVYVPTKGRYTSLQTIRALEAIGVPYRAVVEAPEVDLYAQAGVPRDRILVLPHRDRGLVVTRNWIWDHALAEGHRKFWTMDDNIQGFYRLNRNLKTPVADGTILSVIEDFADRYANLPICGMNYFMFASRKTAVPPLYLNARVYSNMLIETDYRDPLGRPYRNEGFYNDDTDLCLRVLRDGNATVLFNAFLIFKSTTMTVKGGMTTHYVKGQDAKPDPDGRWRALAQKWAAATAQPESVVEEVYGDGRWRMAAELWDKYPTITTITRKWGRWQHHVDYSELRANPLRFRDGAAPADGVDDFGMYLREEAPKTRAPEPKAPKAAPFVFPDRPVGPAPKTQITITAGLSRAAVPKDWTPDPFPDLSRVEGPIGFDTETTGLRWWADDRVCGTSIAWWEGRNLRSAYLPVRHRGGNHDPETFLRWARSPEGLRGRQLVGLNVKFDAHQERESGLDLEALGCQLSDVGHRQGIIDNRTRVFKLDAIAELTLGEGRGKVQGVDVSGGAHVYHAAEVAAYARRDAELPLLILANQVPRIEADGLGRVVDLEDEVQWAVIEMERNGMLLDLDRLAALQKQARNAHDTALGQLAVAAGFACNPSSPDDMERLFRERGIEIRERTEKTGRISLAEGALDGIEDPTIGLARRCHILAGLRSRYLDAYPRLVSPGGVLRYSLHQLRGDEGGTISGRFSCSQAIRDEEGANLQQVITSEKLHDQGIEEYDIRRLFIAPPGRLVVSGDARQIEYRVFAHFTGNPVLLDAYRKDPDVDFHEWVGATVRKHRPDFGRKRIKTVNFMVLFGGGIRKTCEMLGVSEKEGKALLEAYDSTFPDGRRLLRLASQVAENRRYVQTYLGRRARFGPNDRYHKALNAVIQGTAADYNKVKLAALYRARRDFDLTLRLTVHDEVVGDVPDVEAANGLARFLDRQEWPDFKVPLLWSVGTGPSWGEAK
jgi:DNA polymerase I-like protein with 3'-5' exonuclease and polymerase domains